MNGIKFLLDTNFILGMLRSKPEVVEVISVREIMVEQSSYSTISKMELLGYVGIRDTERQLIEEKLSGMVKLDLNARIEEAVIALRQIRRVKLPDAIILATALVNGVELVTLDKALGAAWRELAKP